jgi:hypothetical protein
VPTLCQDSALVGALMGTPVPADMFAQVCCVTCSGNAGETAEEEEEGGSPPPLTASNRNVVQCDGTEAALADCPVNSMMNAFGTGANTFAMVTCTFLGPGDDCNECKEGTYSDTVGDSRCKTCNLGSTLGLLGATSEDDCADCGPGTEFVDWDALYQGLGPNVFQSGQGCTPCQAGMFSNPAIGVHECTNCTAGSWSDTESAECVECTAGTYGNKEAAGPDSCLVCGAGSHSEQASTTCVKCGMGK